MNRYILKHQLETTQHRKSERGNVLFYILIAVALLAALTYAVSQGGRQSADTLSSERANIAATEILEYANALGNAVSQLTLRGCSDTEINFVNNNSSGYTNSNSPTDKTCNVFSIEGGGITYTLPDPNSVSASGQDWMFSGSINATEGTTEGDLVMYLAKVKPQICETLNKLLNIHPAGSYPQDTSQLIYNTTLVKFNGTYGGTYVAHSPNNEDTSILHAKTACTFIPATSTYLFYKILISR